MKLRSTVLQTQPMSYWEMVVVKLGLDGAQAFSPFLALWPVCGSSFKSVLDGSWGPRLFVLSLVKGLEGCHPARQINFAFQRAPNVR